MIGKKEVKKGEFDSAKDKAKFENPAQSKSKSSSKPKQEKLKVLHEVWMAS